MFLGDKNSLMAQGRTLMSSCVLAGKRREADSSRTLLLRQIVTALVNKRGGGASSCRVMTTNKARNTDAGKQGAAGHVGLGSKLRLRAPPCDLLCLCRHR
jgi:hypothetical protein